MKVICIETCTVPGRGFISEGEIYEVEKLDLTAYPFLKFFSDEKGNPILPSEESAEDEGDTVVYPKHVGGGVYELSDGSKVKGKEEAAAAQTALEAKA